MSGLGVVSPLLELHCTNCGTVLRRKRRYRVMLCRGCTAARDAAFMRRIRAERRAAKPAKPPRLCGECHRFMESGAPPQAVYCRSCAKDRLRASQRRTAQRKRGTDPARIRLPETLTPGTPAARLCADRAICRGKCNRRCGCGRLYHLDDLETPCPGCGAHLSDNPLEVSHVEAA